MADAEVEMAINEAFNSNQSSDYQASSSREACADFPQEQVQQGHEVAHAQQLREVTVRLQHLP